MPAGSSPTCSRGVSRTWKAGEGRKVIGKIKNNCLSSRAETPRGGKIRPLNVCLISEEYPPASASGGIGTYAHNLAQGLAEMGHRVHVVARGWGEEGVQEIDGVRVHRVSVPEPSWRWGSHWFVRRFYETRQVVLWNLRAAQVIHRLATAEALDVMESPEYHAQGLFAALRQPGLPLVVKLHGPSYLARQVSGMTAGWTRQDTRASERLEYYTARCARLITSPSRKMAEEIADQWGLSRAAVRIIPNPIDDEFFRPDPATAPDDRTLLYVGRIQSLKGVDTLVEAFPAILRAYPETHLRLVGKDHPSGPGGTSMSDHLRGRLPALGIPGKAIEFTGPIERPHLPSFYRSAAVCVIPSLYENCPYTCLEAMACGCAVVASAVGGIPEIITDRIDGLLVAPKCPEALAAAVVRLLENPALRHELGNRARETVRQRYSCRTICAETALAYQSLLA
jgi:glycogen(starch) synthase